MRIEAVVFTDRGASLADAISRDLAEQDAVRVTRCGNGGPSLADWMDAVFADCDALLFIGAAGIAVRALANRLMGKLLDPAVVVMDEAGRYAIPLLSGHYGGGNALAQRLAACVGATPVITTATDVNGVFAIDVWAREQGLAIINPDAIKRFSGKLLRGETAYLYSEFPVEGSAPPGVALTDSAADADAAITVRTGSISNGRALILVPPALVLGVGCKKGSPAESIEAAWRKLCAANGFFSESIGLACSIDIKRNEPGLVEFCRKRGIPFRVFSAQELAETRGEFSRSNFVAEVTGVDNVCERSAVRGSGGKLALGKTIGDGVALAAALRRYELFFDKE